MPSIAWGAIINIFTLIEKPVYRLIKKSNNNNHTHAYAGDYITEVCVCVCVWEAINCNYQNNRKTTGKKVQSAIVEEEGKQLFVASSYRDPQMDHHLFHIVS